LEENSHAGLHSVGRPRRDRTWRRCVLDHARPLNPEENQRGRREGASNNWVRVRNADFRGHADRRFPDDQLPYSLFLKHQLGLGCVVGTAARHPPLNGRPDLLQESGSRLAPARPPGPPSFPRQGFARGNAFRKRKPRRSGAKFGRTPLSRGVILVRESRTFGHAQLEQCARPQDAALATQPSFMGQVTSQSR
jgi:hypothetical protein